jgi:hypothetical protein
VTEPAASSPADLSVPKRRFLRGAMRAACLSFVVWLPCVPMLMSLKEDVLQHGGYLVVGHNLGRYQTTNATSATDGLTKTDRFALFRNDLVVALVGIPLALIVLSLPFPARYRPLSVALSSTVILMFAYIQYRCLKTVGVYQSFHSLWEAVFWATGNRDLASQYIGYTPGHFKTGATLVLIWGIGIWSARRIARTPDTVPRGRFWYVLPSGIAALMLGTLATELVIRVPEIPLYNSAFFNSARVFFGSSEFYDRQIAELSTNDIIKEYRHLADFPAKPVASPYYGTARDCDVIWFILETAPAQCLPPTDSLDEFPNLQKLAPHSLVALHHDTTFPATLQAVSSLLTSWYPTEIRFQEKLAISRHFSGIGNSLDQARYTTALYSPDPLRSGTKMWFNALGIKRIWSSGGVVRQRPHADPPQERIERDRAALKAMLSDVEKWTKAGQRYFAVYEPQIGHGPWFAIGGTNEKSNIYQKGRALIALQDEWLGEIVSLLKRNGRLDHTIILFTGDHGVRTAFEDPAFRTNLLDERSFHVPFYLYAPTSFRQPLKIDWVTSHIDVAPSILDMLGIDSGRTLEQGSPLWNPEIRNRTTFLWGGDYMGVDGFHQGGQFFSTDLLSGGVMHSDQLRSDKFRLISGADQQKDQRAIATRIERMRMLIHRWAEIDPDSKQQPSVSLNAN